MKRSMATMVLVAGIGVLMIDSGPAAARTTTQKAELENSGVDDNAHGLAKLQVRDNSDGRLDLQVKKLDRRSTYEVLVDGVRVGAILTSGGGNGKIRFRSRPRTDADQLLGFDPRQATITVRNAAGVEVLRVAMVDDSPGDAGDIICCIPDDSGTECEDRTPAECTAQGGTATTATSCLPDPCGAVPPPADSDVICCLPDDSGPECEDRTATECTAQGGVVVEAASCLPNPCAPTTPTPDPDIQCCLPDDSGVQCEDRTPAECAAQGGIDMGPGTCTPNPCVP